MAQHPLRGLPNIAVSPPYQKTEDPGDKVDYGICTTLLICDAVFYWYDIIIDSTAWQWEVLSMHWKFIWLHQP